MTEVRESLEPIANYGVGDERDVLYFLVMVRRLVEPKHKLLRGQRGESESQQLSAADEKRKGSYESLKMFVNWAVHSELSDNKASNGALLDAFSDFWDGNEQAHTPCTSMGLLRAVLEEALIEECIQPSITINEQLWIQFVAFYGTLIYGSPIEIQSTKRTGVTKVVITAALFGRGASEEGAALRWTIWNGAECRHVFGVLGNGGLTSWNASG